MNKPQMNAIVDIAAGIAFLVSAISGFVLWFALPNGGGRMGLETAFLELSRHTWIRMHNMSSLLLVIIIVIHLILHWGWIKNVPRLFRPVKSA